MQRNQQPLLRLCVCLLRCRVRLSRSHSAATVLVSSMNTRGFKTKSYQIGQIPLGSKQYDVSKTVDKLTDLFSSSGSKLDKQTEAEERIKKLLADNRLSDEDKQQIKVAFAEGYLIARGKEKTQPRFRILTLAREALVIIFIIVILSTALGDVGGVRRVLIGNRSEVSPEEIEVTFNDVRGADEAKQELQEIVEFLKEPTKFSRLGGKLPKGVLLVGPPGTGKTLLARAVAGEAGVPFFHVAGPEFDELLVGQGARRVRDLFAAAKQRAPCVIFIDEIDSVGSKRTNSVLHPYANQTINQLLTEMDGFRQNEGVIVLGATNRRDDLDKALLRPGRFDVEVNVPMPDIAGRKDILDLYLSKIKLAQPIDALLVARRTTGFTGADIENMCNQAALRAAIDNDPGVTLQHLENARDKVIMGPERKSRIPDDETNLITAYHEAGHALVAYFTEHSTPLHKVTIVSRGRSLGHTSYIPEKDNYHITKAQMLASLDSALGGRVAEELIFGEEKVTSGASSDLTNATQIATSMVKELGMSSKVGQRTFEKKRELFAADELANSTVESIDTEIKRILQESYDRATHVLKTHSKELRLLAQALLEYETLDAEQVKNVIEGRDPNVRV